ncbi:DUF4097 family beta strand repeat-containing protein [Kitasatospora cineracea]|uniref:DUF4097 family beta strand repeat-containing protein n=1 Tax=Kitasatospora cineracea TaxID=88074 RepID=UPI00343211C2
MTIRTLHAERTGPVTLDLDLPAGTITVLAEAGRERASVTIRTADETGSSADAVTGAVLRWEERGALVAKVEDTGSSITTVVHTGRGTTFVQSMGNVVANGSVIGLQLGSGGVVAGIGNMVVNGNGVFVNGQKISHGGAGTRIGGSPIEITALVPEGSTVLALTRSADIDAEGTLTAVNGRTQSGDIRLGTVERTAVETQSGGVTIDRSQDATIKTQSGGIRLGRTDLVQATTMSGNIRIADFGGTAQLKTMSGDITVHATAGGDLSARTMSGDIDVTATATALDENLDVQTNSMSGRVRTPQHRAAASGARRRRD